MFLLRVGLVTLIKIDTGTIDEILRTVATLEDIEDTMHVS